MLQRLRDGDTGKRGSLELDSIPSANVKRKNLNAFEPHKAKLVAS